MTVDRSAVRKVDDFTYQVDSDYRKDMRTCGRFYTSEGLLEKVLADNAVEQVVNVATLPGIVGPSMAMPDIHWGYGFPIGGVAAFDVDGGVISPGGVGYDINCGMRLLTTDLDAELVERTKGGILKELLNSVPAGVGSKGTVPLTPKDLEEIMERGVSWAVDNDLATVRDLEHTEEGGCLDGAHAAPVSDLARKRGRKQLGSLGAGNHFLELQVVDRVFDEDAARAMGIEEGKVLVMIHTGSRGIGHQVCDDTIRSLQSSFRKDGDGYVSDRWDFRIPDRQLVCAPFDSREGSNYFSAMAAAANFAWTNRQVIQGSVERALCRSLGLTPEDVGVGLVYDHCHNIAKVEEHTCGGPRQKVVIHRKGATRAFPAGHPDIPSSYSSIGQPVIVPGDMGTGSYVLLGTPGSMDLSFGSSCHGAGRILSRKAATRQFTPDQVERSLSDRGVELVSVSRNLVSEEAPGAYKDVDEVVEAAVGSGLVQRAVRLRPIGVMKG